jgi:leader peptidase (prepilin peptidase)/N-methyltransferase
MGSAVSALAWRVPRHRSWVRGRSACPSCGTTLGARDLVPLLSFALARGRCRSCGRPIGWRYPLTEAACAAWTVLLFVRLGPTWALLPLALWGYLLVALLWIDLDFQLLPDVLTLPGIGLGIAAALLLLGPIAGLRHALLGIAVGAGVLWLLGWAWLLVRRIEAMGGGDVKLAAMMGAFLGTGGVFGAIFLASFAGSIFGVLLIARGKGGKRSAIPFGTFLAPSAVALLLYGEALFRWYRSLLP